MKIVFMGTPDFAVPVLEGLIDNYEVVGVVSQPDKEVGRKRILTPTEVKKVALLHKCFTTKKNKRRLSRSIRFRTRYDYNLCIWTNYT